MSIIVSLNMGRLNIYETFLQLVRLGIETRTVNYSRLAVYDSCTFDWVIVKDLAEKQGLYAVVLDGIEKLPQSYRPKQELLLKWIGEVLQGYEYQYEQYCKAVASLAGYYNSHGYKMMVLKGYSCGLNWPKPNHRPYGDIDIWQFGKQKEADRAISRENGIEIDNSHHHHTVFNWDDYIVENHYDFVNVHARRSSAEMEKVFKELGKDDSHTIQLYGKKVYLPSPNLHALFLLKHNASHFVGSNITLRQVLDWAFFVKKHTNEIDWKWLIRMVEEFHMKDFVNCINAICVEELGFDASIFHGVQFNPTLKDRVLADILEPAFATEEPARLIPRLVFKYRRWKGNAWKQELCFNESLSYAFWRGIWNHLLKPASI